MRAKLTFEARGFWYGGVFLPIVAFAFAIGVLDHLDPPKVLGQIATLVLVVVVVPLPFVLTWLRQPHGAAVSWDHRSVTEWDGNGVRVCILWSEARVGVWERSPHLGIEIRDDGGRRIALQSSPPLGERRRMKLDRRSMVELIDAARERAAAVDEDARRPGHARDPLRPLSLAAAVVGYPAVVMAGTRGELQAGLAIAAIVALGALLLRPLGELVRSIRDATPYRKGARVELEPTSRGLIARGADGSTRVLRGLPGGHPDRLIEEREGVAWLVAPSAPGGSAYRGGAPVEPEALESDAARRSRRDLAAALLLELFVRGVLLAYAVFAFTTMPGA